MPQVASPFGLKAKHSPSGVIRPQRWVVPAADIVKNAGSWAQLYQDDAFYLDSAGRLQVSAPTNATTLQCAGSFQGVEFNDYNGRRTVSNQFNPGVIFNPVANQGLGTTDVWFWLYTDPNLVYEVQVNATSTVTTTTTAASAVGATTLTLTSTTGVSAGMEVFVGGVMVGAVATVVGLVVTLQGALTVAVANGATVVFTGLGLTGVGQLLAFNQGTGQNAVTGFSTGYATVAGTQTAGNGALMVYNVAYDNQPNNTYTPGYPTGISGNAIGDPYVNVLVRLANPQFVSAVPGF